MKIHIADMNKFDRQLAANWMTKRVREKSKVPEAVFPIEWLPLTGLSAFDLDEHRLLMVATLYLEQSCPAAVCGWCIGNPENHISVAFEAADMLMRAMPGYAKQHGAAWLLTTFGNRGLNKILDYLGFTNGEVSENKFLLLR